MSVSQLSHSCHVHCYSSHKAARFQKSAYKTVKNNNEIYNYYRQPVIHKFVNWPEWCVINWSIKIVAVPYDDSLLKQTTTTHAHSPTVQNTSFPNLTNSVVWVAGWEHYRAQNLSRTELFHPRTKVRLGELQFAQITHKIFHSDKHKMAYAPWSRHYLLEKLTANVVVLSTEMHLLLLNLFIQIKRNFNECLLSCTHPQTLVSWRSYIHSMLVKWNQTSAVFFSWCPSTTE